MPPTITAPKREAPRAESATAPRRARRRPRRWPLPPALALFLMLAAIYVLTSGGHTYSYDEETMFALTEALVERGSIVIPECSGCTILRAIPIAEGRNYSRYGPVQSLVAIPPYLVGRALAGESDAARWFGTRFAATLLTAFVTAGIGALLYALARRLGYRHGPALATALLYGLATQAWPRAKTFFADPLTTLLIVGAVWCWLRLEGSTKYEVRSTKGAVGWAAGIGLCCGVAVGTKFGAGIILPIFGVAGAASLWRLWRGGELSVRGVVGVVGAAAVAAGVPLALVGWYNWVRFGSPTETGYGEREVGAVQGGDWWAGFAGQIFSPGKGLLVFSPVVILGILSFYPFARRHPRLAALTGALVIAHVAFYARVPQWDAGTSWGPRYLDFIVPLLVLPIAAGLSWLSGQGRAIRLAIGVPAAVVVVAAVVVQLLGVAVNFDAGYSRVQTGRRYWTVANSPPIVHAGILGERVSAWWAIRFPREDAVIPGRGFLITDPAAPLWPRYLPREATLHIHDGGDGPLAAALVYEDARGVQEPPARFTILINGRPVEAGAATPAPDFGPSAYRLRVPLREAGGRDQDFTLSVRNERFDLLGPSWTRTLTITGAGGPVPVRQRPTLLPFPDHTPQRWAWFFTERNAHPLDLWPWYLVVARLPTGFTLTLLLGVGGGATLALLLGAGSLIAQGHRR